MRDRETRTLLFIVAFARTQNRVPVGIVRLGRAVLFPLTRYNRPFHATAGRYKHLEGPDPTSSPPTP